MTILQTGRLLLRRVACPINRFRVWRSFSDYPGKDRARDLLGQYGGGSMGLCKDEQTGIATITINHLERKNALSGKMMLELDEIVGDLETWSNGKAVLLHGSGDTFCSGGDLTLMADICDPQRGDTMSQFMQATTTRLFHLPLVSVALVTGNALGGGAELATACDYRLVTGSAKLGFVQVRLGISTGWGGGTRLCELVGRTNTLELLSAGQLLSAEYMIYIGLANHVVDDGESAVQSAKDWLQLRTEGDPACIQTAKKMVVAVSSGGFEASLVREREVFTQAWGSAVHKALLDKGLKHR